MSTLETPVINPTTRIELGPTAMEAKVQSPWPYHVLPPPLHNEELVDRELVLLVRDGSMSLEDEDGLMTRIINVYTAHMLNGDNVYWQHPVMNLYADASYQKGYELMFRIDDGKPAGIISVASASYVYAYNKEIPRRTWPRQDYPCPLAAGSLDHAEAIRMGFARCETSGFPNYADWFDHIITSHERFVRSKTMGFMDDIAKQSQVMEAMWESAKRSALAYAAERRASDPRLAGQPVAPPPVDGYAGQVVQVGQ